MAEITRYSFVLPWERIGTGSWKNIFFYPGELPENFWNFVIISQWTCQRIFRFLHNKVESSTSCSTWIVSFLFCYFHFYWNVLYFFSFLFFFEKLAPFISFRKELLPFRKRFLQSFFSPPIKITAKCLPPSCDVINEHSITKLRPRTCRCCPGALGFSFRTSFPLHDELRFQGPLSLAD